MSEPSLKMIFVAGAGPGMGKTTLARRLARSLGGEHVEDADVIFARPEFKDVAACFRNGRHPGPPELERAWRMLARSVERASGVTVLDGSFIEGAEDLDWALASEDALHAHARTMRSILAPVRPLLFFMDGDFAEGLRRREAQYGREWFHRQVRPNETWETTFARMKADLVARRPRLLRAFDAGGWNPFLLDASLTEDEVFDTALRVIVRARAS